MFARCFANPTKLVLALREIRAERSRIEQISRTKDLIYKEAGGHVGRPMGAANESHAHKHSGGERVGKKKKDDSYGESGATPESVTRIRQLVRAPRKTAAGPRLGVQQPAHRRVPFGASEARLGRTCVVRRNEV